MKTEDYRYKEFAEETDAIEELMNIDLNGELTFDKISIILSDIHICLHSLGYFEKTVEFINQTLGRLQKVLDAEGEVIYTEDGKIAEFTIKETKELERFADYSGEDVSDISREEMNEKIANMIFWSNKLCHTIDARQLPKSEKEKLEREIPVFSLSDFIGKLYEIKDKGIEEIVKSKSQGDKIIFNTRLDEHNKKVVDIFIPEYLCPFSVHLDQTRDYGIVQEDRIGKSYVPNSVVSKIPFKLNEGQKVCIDWVNTHRNLRHMQKENAIVDMCQSYKNVQTRFEALEKKKKLQEEKAKQNISGVKQEEDVKRYSASKKNSKAIETERDNRQFIKEFNDMIGGNLSPEIEEGLLKRASYSFRGLYDGLLKEKIYEQLDYRGIPEEEKEIESKKVFVYMRMQKSLSLVSAKKIKGEQLDELLEESVSEYEKAWEFLGQNNDKEIDYKNLKRDMKEYVEREEEMTSLESEPESEPEAESEPNIDAPQYEETQEEQELDEADFIDLSLGVKEKNKIDELTKQINELTEESNIENQKMESLRELLVKSAEKIEIQRVLQLTEQIKIVQERLETLEKQIEQLNIEKNLSTEKVAEIKNNAIDRVMEI